LPCGVVFLKLGKRAKRKILLLNKHKNLTPLKKQITKNLLELFESWSGKKADDIYALALSGSERQYYRIISEKKTVLGVYNADKKENIAFLTFTKHFKKNGLAVPEIYKEDLKNDIYLIQDLGDTTLYSYLTQIRKVKDFSPELVALYKQIIKELPEFQINGNKNLDYGVCYPRSGFDKQSMLWDLSYFKYYFLKLAKIPFDEQSLEDDFQKFTDFLLTADCNYFLYRDFQSRNIMLYNNKIYFIDYQGGRKGALQYDLASLLYDAKADIP
jgi:aminoglycoside/choline kinase family phosphotransferase